VVVRADVLTKMLCAFGIAKVQFVQTGVTDRCKKSRFWKICSNILPTAPKWHFISLYKPFPLPVLCLALGIRTAGLITQRHWLYADVITFVLPGPQIEVSELAICKFQTVPPL
jgi:hypothetical protein